MNVSVIHAHPDDELLWAGALILNQPYWDWTLVSLTGGLRQFDYGRLVAAFGRRGVKPRLRMLGFPDSPTFDAAQWDAAIAALPEADLAITHGAGGEYGHPHHVAVHESVHSHFPRVWDFAEGGGRMVNATPDKAALFREVYGEAVYDELRADKTAMIDRLFAREHFQPWRAGA